MEGDGQVNNLLTVMEELNDELEEMREVNGQLEVDLEEREQELKEAMMMEGVGMKGVDVEGLGGALLLVERGELIQLRSEVAEYEVEFRGIRILPFASWRESAYHLSFLS